MISARAIRLMEDAGRNDSGLRARVVNVGEAERVASQVGGGVLVAAGLVKGGLKGLLMAGLGGALLYRGASGHCTLYHAIGASTAEEADSTSVPAQTGVRVEEAVTIERTPEELYDFWKDYANLPKFMTDIESVIDIGGNRSHWVMTGPGGLKIEWDSEILNDEPGRMIAWRSLEGSQMQTAGSVHFTPAPGGRGTEVLINQKFNPPGGQLGAAVAKLLGHGPTSITRESLRKLKMLMEAGEIATTAGQSSGR